jgi:putative hydrolase of the HAD superfamily
MIKAIIFDLDNTLFDFMRMKRMAIESAILSMTDAGLDLRREEISSIINEIYQAEGMEYQQVFDELLVRVLKRVDHKILAAGIVSYRRSREAALIPYPHVHSTLHELAKRHIKLGVLSDAPVREAWLRLAYMNLLHQFDAVVTHEDTGKRKPDPDTFLTVLGRLDEKPENALMVGDWAERDMVGAANVGMKTAFAKYGDSFNTVNYKSDYTLDDISNLLSIVDAENGVKA